jgi:hypothetical protein
MKSFEEVKRIQERIITIKEKETVCLIYMFKFVFSFQWFYVQIKMIYLSDLIKLLQKRDKT